MYKYPIKYKIDFGEFTKEELAKDDAGGCDTIAIVSVMGKFGEGALSIALIAANPDKSDWDAGAWFQTMAMIANKIKDSPDLQPWQRMIANNTFEEVRGFILKGRDDVKP